MIMLHSVGSSSIHLMLYSCIRAAQPEISWQNAANQRNVGIGCQEWSPSLPTQPEVPVNTEVCEVTPTTLAIQPEQTSAAETKQLQAEQPPAQQLQEMNPTDDCTDVSAGIYRNLASF